MLHPSKHPRPAGTRSLIALMILSAAVTLWTACGRCPLPSPAPVRDGDVALSFRLGIEVLANDPKPFLKDGRVGLVTHAAAIDQSLRSSVDILFADKSVKLTALFSPEHGIRGSASAGEKVEGGRDPVTSLPVRSLYGKTKKPTAEMLADVDVIVVDLQDIGSRSYTYISTLYYVMEAAAENKRRVVVCDRPNPTGGAVIDGPILEPAFKSFIGIAPIPVVHGMTIGELAEFFNRELGIGCDLQVVTMRGWRHGMPFRMTGLFWAPPSPHIPTDETALYYPITGLIGEMGTLSEGVGTPMPFRLLGAPWMDGRQLAQSLPPVPGIAFRPITVKPYYFRFIGEEVHGVQLYVTDPQTYRPVEAAVHLLCQIRRLWPAHLRWHPEGNPDQRKNVDSAWGTDRIRTMIDAGEPAEKIIATWQPALQEFRTIRARHLLYP